MSVVLATLCLNEIEWLDLLYEQHKNWPGLTDWIFVEAADRVFAETNPNMVTKDGLSIDGTSEYLKALSERDPRVTYCPFGFSVAADPAQGKVPARNRYMELIDSDQLNPKYLIIIDADEFYTKADQELMAKVMDAYPPSVDGFTFRQRHIWRPSSLAARSTDLLGYEVQGGYWKVPHTRAWRWREGLRYIRDHNRPERARLIAQLYPTYSNGLPQCVHLGFASSTPRRRAKHDYYKARGEGLKDGRQMYVDCREAFHTWMPWERLPHGARVVCYTGPIPEVFQ